jgi:hypothetical protein
MVDARPPPAGQVMEHEVQPLQDPDPDVLAPEQLSGVDYERDRERVTHLPLIVQRLPSSAGPPPSVDAMWLTGLEMSQYEDGAAADAAAQT